jgi:hypothetical protein
MTRPKTSKGSSHAGSSLRVSSTLVSDRASRLDNLQDREELRQLG